MSNSIYITQEGKITSISIFTGEYPYLCPEFIDFQNFDNYQCVNINDHMNPDSWILINQQNG